MNSDPGRITELLEEIHKIVSRKNLDRSDLRKLIHEFDGLSSRLKFYRTRLDRERTRK